MGDLSDSLNEISSRDLLIRMVTYAVRCPEVAKVATEKLSPTHFDEGTQLEFMMVWHVASTLWNTYQTVPEPQHLADLSVNLMVQQGYTDPAYHQMARDLVQQIYAFTETPWNVDYGMRLLNVFFNNVFIQDLSRVAQQFTGHGRDDIIERVQSAHRQLQVDKPVSMDPFDLTEHTPSFIPRVPTGVSFFDMLLGGGTLPTECYGILGPSGGGKTLLAIQIACSMAERGQHVEYFSYEQPVKDIQPRVLSCAAKVPIDKISGRSWADMGSDIQQKIQRVATTSKSYLHLHDRSADGSSIADIGNVIRERLESGVTPSLVVVDWIWPLVLRMLANSNRRNAEERKILQAVSEEFKSMAAKYNVAFLLLHQLSTEMVKKSPSKKPQWFNSAEAGSFAWLLHYCIAIGRADAQGYCWLVGSKARNAAAQDTLVKRDGLLQRFDATKSSMVYDTRRSEFVDEDKMNRMPGADVSDDEPMSAEEEELAGGGGAGIV